MKTSSCHTPPSGKGLTARYRHAAVVIAITVITALIAGCAVLRAPVETQLRISDDEVPSAVRLLFSNAETAYGDHRYDVAMDLYGQILSLIPEGKVVSWAHLRRGEILIIRKGYREAVTELKDIPKRFEGDPLFNEARYFLARAYTRLSMFDRSERIIAGLLKESLTTQREAALKALTGDNLAGRNRYSDALTAYMTALDIGPGDVRAAVLKERIETIIDFHLTMEELEEVYLSCQSRFPAGYALYRLALSHYRERNLERASQMLDQLLERFPGHALFEEADMLRREIAQQMMVKRYAIGCILPLTGRYAAFGTRVLDAVILAAGVFEASRESNVTLIIEDSKSSAAAARDGVLKLTQVDGVIGIIGPMGSATSLEAARAAQERSVPILTLSQMENITETGDYVFRTSLNAAMQIKTLVDYSVNHLGMESFAILHPRDRYGTEMMHLFWDEVRAYGGEIRGVESYSTEQTDFGKEIKGLTGLDILEKTAPAAEDPPPIVDFDALFIPDSYSRVAMIAPQLAFYDVTTVQLLGTSAWNNPDLLSEEETYLNGAIFADGFFLNSFRHDVRNFIDKFYAAFGREPASLEALAYDATRIMVDVIEQSHIEFRDQLRDEMLSIRDYQGITGETSFSPTGDAEKSLSILMVLDNTIIQIH